ncbi:hypothetical protein GQ457_04G028390 [Hibiscus cannabinus]
MEMNQRRSPKGVCEKIFRAMALGPAFTTIHRSITSPPPQQTSLKHPPLPNSLMLASPHFPEPAAADQGAPIPVRFDYTTAEKPNKEEAKKPANKYASFDEFIKETKKRIMSDDDHDDSDKVVVEFGKNPHFSG